MRRCCWTNENVEPNVLLVARTAIAQPTGADNVLVVKKEAEQGYAGCFVIALRKGERGGYRIERKNTVHDRDTASLSICFSRQAHRTTLIFSIRHCITTTHWPPFWVSLKHTHIYIRETLIQRQPEACAMCTALFSLSSSCPCPPTPTHPYLRLCPVAKQQNPVRACPVGSRMSQTRWVGGKCAWCAVCQGEALRGDRRDWARAVLARGARPPRG